MHSADFDVASALEATSALPTEERRQLLALWLVDLHVLRATANGHAFTTRALDQAIATVETAAAAGESPQPIVSVDEPANGNSGNVPPTATTSALQPNRDEAPAFLSAPILHADSPPSRRRRQLKKALCPRQPRHGHAHAHPYAVAYVDTDSNGYAERNANAGANGHTDVCDDSDDSRPDPTDTPYAPDACPNPDAHGRSRHNRHT